MKTPPITKWQLFQAFVKGMPLAGFNVITSIEREDGSGSSFNVTGHAKFAPEKLSTFHFLTID